MNKKEEWAKHIMERRIVYPSVNQFAEWLQNIAGYISIAIGSASAMTTDKTQEKKNQLKHIFTVDNKQERSRKCPICNHDHKLYQRDNFKKKILPEKWEIVKKQNRRKVCNRQKEAFPTP